MSLSDAVAAALAASPDLGREVTRALAFGYLDDTGEVAWRDDWEAEEAARPGRHTARNAYQAALVTAHLARLGVPVAGGTRVKCPECGWTRLMTTRCQREDCPPPAGLGAPGVNQEETPRGITDHRPQSGTGSAGKAHQ